MSSNKNKGRTALSMDSEPKGIQKQPTGWAHMSLKPHVGIGEERRIEFRSKQPSRSRGWIHELADEMRKGGESE